MILGTRPDKPTVVDGMKWYQKVWHVLQLAAWYVWPSNNCIYCFFYRGVLIGMVVGGLIGWTIG